MLATQSSSIMEDEVTKIVVNSTVSDWETDDTLCCSSEKQSIIEWFLNFDPQVVMWQFIPPVIIVLGTFGNVMTIVIMRRMSEGQSSHTMSLYFTALAVSDLVLLYSGLIKNWTVSLVFLLLSLPLCIYLIVEYYINTGEAVLVYAVCDLSWYANSAINFYLYCLTGSRFKNELKSLFCGRFPAPKPSALTSRTNQRFK
ncbi:uncharacterized protein LOC112570386 [Pomacea canaliculata]|uniref:uncharacterized protein LOC112570386 n=1 Tax=Pomacea canaliculata TaxID=400727 RepID=UPI000D725E4F|nr:uncharacterized protein LOC112570386 [Pomacea canaliculata]